jgi:hypothetical protein
MKHAKSGIGKEETGYKKISLYQHNFILTKQKQKKHIA